MFSSRNSSSSEPSAKKPRVAEPTSLPSLDALNHQMQVIKDCRRDIEGRLDQRINELQTSRDTLLVELASIKKEAKALADRLPPSTILEPNIVFKSAKRSFELEYNHPKMLRVIELQQEVEQLNQRKSHYQARHDYYQQLIKNEEEREALAAKVIEEEAQLKKLESDACRLFFRPSNGNYNTSPTISTTSQTSKRVAE